MQWCAGRFYYFLKGVVSDLSCPLILLGTEVSTWRYIWIKWPGNAPLWLSLTLATCWTKAPASQLFGQFAGGLHENKRDCQRNTSSTLGGNTCIKREQLREKKKMWLRRLSPAAAAASGSIFNIQCFSRQTTDEEDHIIFQLVDNKSNKLRGNNAFVEP